MSEHHPNIETSFAQLDGPVAAPDRVRSGLHRQIARRGSQPTSLAEYKPTRIPTTRRRLLDLVAVAVLLLTMIGSLAGTTQLAHSPSTPSAIPAPGAVLPTLQFGGTAAQDYQFPGPAPVSGTVQTVWESPAESDGSYLRGGYISGDYVYGAQFPKDGGPFGKLVAFNLADGTIAWQRQTFTGVAIVVTAAGIVAGDIAQDAAATPVNLKSPPWHLALLDRSTGQPIWSAKPVVDGITLQPGNGLAVDGDAVYASDRFGHLISLALSTGALNWTYTWERALHPGVEQTECLDVRSPTDCFDRTSFQVLIAVKNGSAYIADPVTMTIQAIDTDTGKRVWSSDLLADTGGPDWLGQIIALDAGVIYSTVNLSAQDLSQYGAISMLDARDGSRRWDAIATNGSPLVSDGQVVYGTQYAGETTFLVAIDSADGRVVWHTPTVDNAFARAYLSAERTVVYQTTRTPYTTFGIDPGTQQVLWRVTSDDLSCTLIFPLSDSGLSTCNKQSTGQLRVLRIDRSGLAIPTATPVIANTQQNPPVVNADVTDSGQIRGLPISTSAYTTLWTSADDGQPGDIYPTVFRYNIYRTTTNPSDGTVNLVSQDLMTGRLLWSVPIPAHVPYLATDQGVVTLLPDPFGDTVLRPVVLTLESGQARTWGDASFRQPTEWGGIFLDITGNTILVKQDDGHIAALDFHSGTQKWAYASDTTLAPGLDEMFPCSTNEICTGRRSLGPQAVSDGTFVYLANNIAATVTALDLETGAVVWQRSILDLVPAEEFNAVWIAATGRGLLVQFSRPPSDSNLHHPSMELWSAKTGEVIWTSSTIVSVGSPVVTDHDTFYVAAMPTSIQGSPVPSEEACCHLAEYSLIDGSLVWQDTDTQISWVLGYFPDWDQLVTNFWKPESPIPVVVGRDATTHATVWTFDAGDFGCIAVRYPIGPAGALLCQNQSNQVAVYGPVPEPAATPSG